MAYKLADGSATGQRGLVQDCAGHRQNARTAKTRQSLYDDVAQTIVAQMEQGLFPWVQPWSNATATQGLPRNATTGHVYSGINILILWGAVIQHGFARQDWLTFKQAQALGGMVCKGAHGQTVFYADRFTPKADTDGQNGSLEVAPQSIPFLKRFTVFNVAQCEGLPASLLDTQTPLPVCVPHEGAEALAKSSGADIRIGGAQAFYSPSDDYVQVPPQPAFTDPINYYRTLLHELGHWTGHSARLNRHFKGCFGSADYAREELVAELTAAFVCAALGIVPTVRHADYLGTWLSVLRDDNRAIFRAASLASKAASYLLAFAPNTDPSSA